MPDKLKSQPTVRVGALQVGPAADSHSQTLQENLSLVSSAISEHRLELITLTELAMAPYFCSVIDDTWFDWAEPLDGPSFKVFSELARKTRCHIALPIFEKAGGSFYNSLVVIDDEGRLVIGRSPSRSDIPAYRKIHLPTNRDEVTGDLRSNEPYYFRAGDEIPVFDTKIGVLGSLICFDKRFSELWRALGIAGAEIVLNPICTWGDWRNETYPLEVRVAAMNNQYFVAGTSKAGVEDIGFPHRFAGGCHIAAPDGRLLSSVPVTVGGLAFADCDLNEVARARMTTPIYRDRRPGAYRSLMDPYRNESA